ncbi:hypothetical protein K492DRAFT_40828 [Lichtheimia hyalospora FSU 10163]|nr:hypothetical protein K492DRAFT_40828 [Lichtheimia hyalospora FSU 10163]
MPSMNSDNGVNRLHDPWSMGYASFRSHGTASTRDLPMTRDSFQHRRLLFSRLYKNR